MSSQSSARAACPDKANPIATVLCVKEMLEWLASRHQDDALARMARAIEQAVQDTLREGTCLTADLGGKGKAANLGGFEPLLALTLFEDDGEAAQADRESEDSRPQRLPATASEVAAASLQPGVSSSR